MSAPLWGILGTGACSTGVLAHAASCQFICNSGYVLTGASTSCLNGVLTSVQTCNGEEFLTGPLISSIAGNVNWDAAVAPDSSGNVYAAAWLSSNALYKITSTGAWSSGFGSSNFHYNVGLAWENSANPGLWFLMYYAMGGSAGSTGQLIKITFSSPGVYSTYSQIGPTTGSAVQGVGVDSTNLFVYWGDGATLHKMTTTGGSLTSWSASSTILDISIDPINSNLYVSTWGSGIICYSPSGSQQWSNTAVSPYWYTVAWIYSGVLFGFKNGFSSLVYTFSSSSGSSLGSLSYSSTSGYLSAIKFSPYNNSGVSIDWNIGQVYWLTGPPCSIPSVPSNGGLGTCANGADSGASCSFTCNTNYVLSVPSSICSGGS